jgi:hypothetical protein
MASLDPTWVAAQAAIKLKVTEAAAQPAADAAVAYIATYHSVLETWLPDDDAQLNIGAPLLAVRIYQDAAVPSGSTSSFDDFTSGSFIPMNLYSHLDQYFRFLVPVDPAPAP